MSTINRNPLRTRPDVAEAALALLSPLTRHMGPGRICLGHTGATYPEDIAQMEAFARPLWAIVPLLAGDHPGVADLWALWREGIARGVDPQGCAYWGNPGPFDQRIVEMAVFGVGMALAKPLFWDTLSPEAQDHLANWLRLANDQPIPDNNWAFFRIMVNVGLMKVGQPHDAARLAADLATIDAHDDGDGWYWDHPDQRDYYTPWGFHFFGLLYAHLMADQDPSRCARYRERALAFAPRFAAWFAADGSALPYGRSLTYRFAQGAFFSAMALGGNGGALSWGQMKGLLLRNLRYWLAAPIFTSDGVLTIGYGYPNLCMADIYNAPGSPYWAMLSFLALAAPEDHPFWASEEVPYEPPRQFADTHARMLLARDNRNAHVQAFTAGNHAPGRHGDAKYEKFVYSTAFAFSVPHGARTLEEGAFDSMLALSLDGLSWRVRYGVDSFEILEDRVKARWQPYPGVQIETTLLPMGDWHLRLHQIEASAPLQAAEGGFAFPKDHALPVLDCGRAVVLADDAASGIIAFAGYLRAEILSPTPNSNLLHARTLLPTLRAEIPKGRTTLCCAVLGAMRQGKQTWDTPPGKETIHAIMGKSGL